MSQSDKHDSLEIYSAFLDEELLESETPSTEVDNELTDFGSPFLEDLTGIISEESFVEELEENREDEAESLEENEWEEEDLEGNVFEDAFEDSYEEEKHKEVDDEFEDNEKDEEIELDEYGEEWEWEKEEFVEETSQLNNEFDAENELDNIEYVVTRDVHGEVDGAPIFGEETKYGAKKTRSVVKWYQTILRVIEDLPELPLNGNHNDPSTRKALRAFQSQHKLKATGYLTVESNAALSQAALQWIFHTPIPNKPGKWTPTLRAWIRQFQEFYKISQDGKIGPETMEKMSDVLNRKIPTPVKNFHYHLGAPIVRDETAIDEDEVDNVFDAELDTPFKEGPLAGVLGRDQRKLVDDLTFIPTRWICRVSIEEHNGNYFRATGFLISNQHVLTAAHVLLGDVSDEDGNRIFKRPARMSVEPAFDGRITLRRKFRSKEPFGSWVVDMEESLVLPKYINKDRTGNITSINKDWDIAVLKLRDPVGKKDFKLRRRKPKKPADFLIVSPFGFWGHNRNTQISATTQGEADNRTVFTAGYPTEFRLSQRSRMIQTAGETDNTLIETIRGEQRDNGAIEHSNMFSHRLDTTNGQSGSPIWAQKKVGESDIFSILGVVVRSQNRWRLRREFQNTAIALTPEILKMIADLYGDTFEFKDGELRIL